MMEKQTSQGSDRLNIVLMLGFLLASTSLSLLPVVAPELERLFGLSDSQVGSLMSAFLLAYGLVQIPAGALASRRGGSALGAALAIMAIGSLLFAVVSSYPWFVVARVVQGLGAGMVLPSSGAVMARLVPAARLGRAWGIFGAGWGGGVIVALLVLPALQSAAGFRSVLVAVAGLALVLGVVAYLSGALTAGRMPAAAISSRRLVEDLGTIARDSRSNLLGLLNAMALAVGVSAVAWTPSFLSDTHEAPEQTAALLTAGLGVAQIVATPAGAALAGRFGPRLVLFGSFIGLAGLSAIVPWLPNALTVSAVILLVGFFSMVYFPPTFSLVPRVVAPPMVGLANGYVNALGFLGSLLAPWVFGLFLDSGWGYSSGYLLLAACGVVGILAVRLIPSSLTREVSADV
jgi:MFS family permease